MNLLGKRRENPTDAGLNTIVQKLDHITAQLHALEHRLNLMEHFSHGARATYVGDGRVLMKCVVDNAQIAFLVEAHDKLLAPWFIVSGAYETDVTRYFTRALARDSHCIDVGANFGYFTCLMGRFCPEGRVIGIEADQPVYELVRDNVFINGFNTRTEVLCAAASDKKGELTLHRRGTRSGNTSIARLPKSYTESLGEPESVPFSVSAIPLDELMPRLNGRVDFIKIDVEGAEPLVFRGARAMIAANPQVRIVMEWSPGQMRAAGFGIPEFLAELADMGLRAHDIGSENPLDLRPLSTDELAGLDYRAGVVLTRN